MDGTLKIDHVQVGRIPKSKPLKYIFTETQYFKNSVHSQSYTRKLPDALTLAHKIECVCFSLFLAEKKYI